MSPLLKALSGPLLMTHRAVQKGQSQKHRFRVKRQHVVLFCFNRWCDKMFHCWGQTTGAGSRAGETWKHLGNVNTGGAAYLVKKGSFACILT